MLFPHDLQRFYERVPDEQMSQRLEDYNKLRRNHFSDWESVKIITTLTREDKDGKRYLQALDLTTDAWQQTMKERTSWHDKKMKFFLRKGLTRRQSNRAIQNELEDFFSTRTGDTRKDPTPWSGIRDIYKEKSSPRVTGPDFIDNLRKREQNYRKKRMPYSAVR